MRSEAGVLLGYHGVAEGLWGRTPDKRLLGFVVMLVNDRNQRVGDIAAQTVMVRAEPSGRVP